MRNRIESRLALTVVFLGSAMLGAAHGAEAFQCDNCTINICDDSWSIPRPTFSDWDCDFGGADASGYAMCYIKTTEGGMGAPTASLKLRIILVPVNSIWSDQGLNNSYNCNINCKTDAGILQYDTSSMGCLFESESEYYVYAYYADSSGNRDAGNSVTAVCP